MLFRSTHTYSANPNSAWDLYNHVTLALKDSHPLNYLSDHQKVHTFFVNEFGQLQNIYAPVEDEVDPEGYEQEFPLATIEEEPETVDSDFGVVFN